MLFNENGSTNFITVTQLNGYIHGTLSREDILSRIIVLGEISGYKTSGAHAYFTLKDSGAAIACSCFNYARQMRIHDGDSVLIEGSVDYYERTGKLSLIVRKMEAVGEGVLHAQFEQLKKRLSEEGLFDEAHKKPLPTFCRNVCVITSRTGAVLQDIQRTIRLKNSSLNIYYVDARVQGSGAEKTIVSALKYADRLGFDVIIIARGGGSFEDLFCFNDEVLARTIYAAKTPIVSAVGHETDYTVCDFVADLRAATPTAAAEIVAYDEDNLRRLLGAYLVTQKNSLDGIMVRDLGRVQSATALMRERVLTELRATASELKRMSGSITQSMMHKTQVTEKNISSSLELISSHNPANILKKGFAHVTTGGHVFRVSTAHVGDEIGIQAEDGNATAVVTALFDGDKPKENR